MQIILSDDENAGPLADSRDDGSIKPRSAIRNPRSAADA
jgi:hypothetical protein